MTIESPSLRHRMNQLSGVEQELTNCQAESEMLAKRLAELKAARQTHVLALEKGRAYRSKLGQVPVSEHAIVRYFERVLGYDLDEIRAAIMPEIIERSAAVLGNGIFPVGQTHRLRVHRGVVVTVLPGAAPMGAKDSA